MHEVTVNRTRLLGTIKENKDKHIADYEEAIEGWKEQWAAKLNKHCHEMNAGNGYWDKKAGNCFLSKPVEHIQDYDQAIAMLDMEVNVEIVVSAEDIKHFVRDEWCWSEGFHTIVSGYSNRV